MMKTRKFKENSNRKIAIFLSLALILSTFMETNINATAIGINGTDVLFNMLSSDLEQMTSAEAAQYMLDYYADDPFYQARNNPNFNWYLELSKAAYKTTAWFLDFNSQGISNEQLFEVMTYEQWKKEDPSMIIELIKGDVTPGSTKAAYWEWFFTKFGYDSSKQKYRLIVDTYIPALGRTVTDYVYGTKPADFYDHVPIQFWKYFVQTQAEWFYNIFQRESSYRNIEQSLLNGDILGTGNIITPELSALVGSGIWDASQMDSSLMGYLSFQLTNGDIYYYTISKTATFNSYYLTESRRFTFTIPTYQDFPFSILLNRSSSSTYGTNIKFGIGTKLDTNLNKTSTGNTAMPSNVNSDDVIAIDWYLPSIIDTFSLNDGTMTTYELEDILPMVFPNLELVGTIDPSIIRPEELDLQRQGFAPDILNPPSDIPIPIPGLEDIPLPGILTPDIPDVLNPDLPWEYPDDAPPFVIDQDGNITIPWDYTWPWDEPIPIPDEITGELDFPVPPIPPTPDDRTTNPTIPNLVYLLGLILIRILVLLLKVLGFVRSLVDLQPSSTMIQADMLDSIERMRNIIIPGFNIKFQVFAQWVVVFVSSISIVGIIRKRIDRFKA